MTELTCPHCKNVGTDAGCKDFFCINLGTWRCKKCDYKFSLLKKVPENATPEESNQIIRENIITVRGLLDPCQNRAIDAILSDAIPKKTEKKCDHCNETATYFHSRCCMAHMEGMITKDGEHVVVCEKCSKYVGTLRQDKKYKGAVFVKY